MIEKFMHNIGLFEHMLGKYDNLVLYDQDKEKLKRFLYEIFNKKDVYILFPPELDNTQYKESLQTIFQYYDNRDNTTESSK